MIRYDLKAVVPAHVPSGDPAFVPYRSRPANRNARAGNAATTRVPCDVTVGQSVEDGPSLGSKARSGHRAQSQGARAAGKVRGGGRRTQDADTNCRARRRGVAWGTRRGAVGAAETGLGEAAEGTRRGQCSALPPLRHFVDSCGARDAARSQVRGLGSNRRRFCVDLGVATYRKYLHSCTYKFYLNVPRPLGSWFRS